MTDAADFKTRMLQVMRQRFHERLEVFGWSANYASVKAGVDRSVLGKFLAGRSSEIKDHNLVRLAQALDCSPAWLRGEISSLYPEAHVTEGGNQLVGRHSLKDVPILAELEAGASYPIDWFSDLTLGYIVGGFDPKYSKVRQFGYTVRDNSMDLAGLTDGDSVVCIDPWENGAEISNGDWVVLQILSERGKKRELRVAEAVVIPGGMQFISRSSDKRYKTSVEVPADANLRQYGTLSVLAIIVSAVKHRPPLRMRPVLADTIAVSKPAKRYRASPKEVEEVSAVAATSKKGLAAAREKLLRRRLRARERKTRISEETSATPSLAAHNEFSLMGLVGIGLAWAARHLVDALGAVQSSGIVDVLT